MRVCQPSPQSALHSPHWPYTSWALLSNDWSEKGEPPPLPLELALPGWKGTSGGGGDAIILPDDTVVLADPFVTHVRQNPDEID